MIDLRDLLKRIRQWDALDVPDSDGAYWKREIDAALEQQEPGSVCARCGGWVCDPVIPLPEQDTDCHAQGVCQRSGYGIKQQEPAPDRWGAGYEAGYAAGMVEMKPEQEPVACLVRNRSVRTPSRISADGIDRMGDWSEWKEATLSYGLAVTDPTRNYPQGDCQYEMRYLYTHPPRREWQFLSAEERYRIADESASTIVAVLATEAALRSKNHE